MTDWYKHPIWLYYNDRFGWFRILGYGLKWKDTTKHPLCFSERVLGHGRQIGKWRFGILTPNGC